MINPTQPEPQPLVYGEIDEGLVFIPRARADELIAGGDFEACWPIQEMPSFMPGDLLARPGVITRYLLDGDFVSFPLLCEHDPVRDLRSRGWICERDDATVLEASGY